MDEFRRQGAVASTFGGFNTILRDFARFGLVMLNDGKLGDEQIFSNDWVKAAYTVTDEDIEYTTRSVYKDESDPAYDDKLIAYKNF